MLEHANQEPPRNPDATRQRTHKTKGKRASPVEISPGPSQRHRFRTGGALSCAPPILIQSRDSRQLLPSSVSESHRTQANNGRSLVLGLHFHLGLGGVNAVRTGVWPRVGTRVGLRTGSRCNEAFRTTAHGFVQPYVLMLPSNRVSPGASCLVANTAGVEFLTSVVQLLGERRSLPQGRAKVVDRVHGSDKHGCNAD